MPTPSINSTGFTFGSPVTTSSTGFTFESLATTSNTGFTSGRPAATYSAGFSFGSPATTSSTGFTFRSPATTSSAGFTIGTPAATSSAGFTFRSPATTSSTGFTFGSPATTSSTGFTFGSLPSFYTSSTPNLFAFGKSTTETSDSPFTGKVSTTTTQSSPTSFQIATKTTTPSGFNSGTATLSAHLGFSLSGGICTASTSTTVPSVITAFGTASTTTTKLAFSTSAAPQISSAMPIRITSPSTTTGFQFQTPSATAVTSTLPSTGVSLMPEASTTSSEISPNPNVTPNSGPELAAIMKIGTRVVKGIDWISDNQDGPSPGEGTVVFELNKAGWIGVRWDTGHTFGYRMGNEGKYDLKLADPSPVQQPDSLPDSMNENGKVSTATTQSGPTSFQIATKTTTPSGFNSGTATLSTPLEFSLSGICTASTSTSLPAVTTAFETANTTTIKQAFSTSGAPQISSAMPVGIISPSTTSGFQFQTPSATAVTSSLPSTGVSLMPEVSTTSSGNNYSMTYPDGMWKSGCDDWCISFNSTEHVFIIWYIASFLRECLEESKGLRSYRFCFADATFNFFTSLDRKNVHSLFGINVRPDTLSGAVFDCYCNIQFEDYSGREIRKIEFNFKCLDADSHGSVKDFLSSREFDMLLQRGVSIECSITLKKSSIKDEFPQTKVLHSSFSQTVDAHTQTQVLENEDHKLCQDFKKLLLSEEGSDVILQVQDQQFKAHRSILTARSSVFAAMFRNEMKEKATGVANVEDCELSSFPVLLEFMYCGATEKLSVENIFDLYTSSDKYDVGDLKMKCLQFIQSNISVDTFCKTLRLALQHSETNLLKLATEFFVRNCQQITETSEWQTFLSENPIQGSELFMKAVRTPR